VESFNARLKLFLKGEIFDTLKEAQIVIEQWRVHYNTVRPHSSLGHRPPAPETALLPSPLPPLLRRQQKNQKSVTEHLVLRMGADQYVLAIRAHLEKLLLAKTTLREAALGVELCP
jgi:hypothetical protein